MPKPDIEGDARNRPGTLLWKSQGPIDQAEFRQLQNLALAYIRDQVPPEQLKLVSDFLYYNYSLYYRRDGDAWWTMPQVGNYAGGLYVAHLIAGPGSREIFDKPNVFAELRGELEEGG